MYIFLYYLYVLLYIYHCAIVYNCGVQYTCDGRKMLYETKLIYNVRPDPVRLTSLDELFLRAQIGCRAI